MMKEDIQIEEFFREKRVTEAIKSFCRERKFSENEIETILRYLVAVEDESIRAENLEKIEASKSREINTS